jgi:hypothetical protein
LLGQSAQNKQTNKQEFHFCLYKLRRNVYNSTNDVIGIEFVKKDLGIEFPVFIM